MMRVGIDITTRAKEDDAFRAALDAKAHFKFSSGAHERGYFRHGGAFRHLDYVYTPTFHGHDSSNNAETPTKPGIDLPAAVLSLTEQDLFDYCRMVIDPDTKKPRNPQEIQRDPHFQTFRIKIFGALQDGLEEQRAAVQKQEDVFRAHQRYRIHTQGAKEGLEIFENDIATIENYTNHIRAEKERAERVAGIVELTRRTLNPEEADVMFENTSAAIRSNTTVLQGVIHQLQKRIAPKLEEKINTIAQQEQDKKRNGMIQELLSDAPTTEKADGHSRLFIPLLDPEYRANAMLIAGIRSELISRAQKQGDRRAAELIRGMRVLKNIEDTVLGFKNMLVDIDSIQKEKKSA